MCLDDKNMHTLNSLQMLLEEPMNLVVQNHKYFLMHSFMIIPRIIKVVMLNGQGLSKSLERSWRYPLCDLEKGFLSFTLLLVLFLTFHYWRSLHSRSSTSNQPLMYHKELTIIIIQVTITTLFLLSPIFSSFRLQTYFKVGKNKLKKLN